MIKGVVGSVVKNVFGNVARKLPLILNSQRVSIINQIRKEI